MRVMKRYWAVHTDSCIRKRSKQQQQRCSEQLDILRLLVQLVRSTRSHLLRIATDNQDYIREECLLAGD